MTRRTSTRGSNSVRRQRAWANARFFQSVTTSSSISRDLLIEYRAARSTDSFKGWTVGGIHLTLIAATAQTAPALEPLVDFGLLVGHVDRITAAEPDVGVSEAFDDWMMLGMMAPTERGGPAAVRQIDVGSMRKLGPNDSLFLQTRLTTNAVDTVQLSVRSRVLLLQP